MRGKIINLIRQQVKGKKPKEVIMAIIFFLCACVSVLAIATIAGFLFTGGLPAMREIGVREFFLGTLWAPRDRYPSFGILPMIAGSVTITLGAIIIGVPIGVFTAVFLAYMCPRRLYKIIKPVVNLLAGIPSVVYGFFGMVVIVPFLRPFAERVDAAGIPTGNSILAASILLGIMILPVVIGISESAIRAVPDHYYEGALALGASKLRSVLCVVVPAAKSGILAAVVLGVGRAIGETMAVNMVAGNQPRMPIHLLRGARSLTANVVMEMSYASDLHRESLIATGVVLLLFILLINMIFVFFVNRKVSKAPQEGSRFSNATNKSMVYLKWAIPFVMLLLGEFYFNNRWIVLGSSVFMGIPLTRRAYTLLSTHVLKWLTKLWDKLFYTLTWVFAAITVLALGFIFFHILSNGFRHLATPGLFAIDASTPGVSLFPSIVSTILMVALVLAIAVPLGVFSAVFLVEYMRTGSRFVTIIRSAAEILAGIPSIVYGLFGMMFFRIFLGLGISVLSGALTMSIMMLPLIIRSTEEALKSVPDTYREASFGLGAGKLRTVFKIILPSAIPGILAGVILAIGRVVGESAALIFTAGALQVPRIPTGLMDTGTTLTVHMWQLSNYGRFVNETYAAAVVLLLVVFCLNGVSGLVARRFSKT